MLNKNIHEIRDPIHIFIHLDTDERRVLDSRYFQRLRHIHQLALSYLVYPGATHKRFEHSLGTMELASRVFDVVTQPYAIHERIRRLINEISIPDTLTYWRRVLRMDALCHDIGHLPFSHAAEKELLPDGMNHELLTVEIIKSAEMRTIWENMALPLRADDIAKLAVGPEKLKDEQFTDWETILSEIVVGDAFGVDRIDYLLRDSHHVGVAYGKFDHYRLIDTIRILPKPESEEPELGIEVGGIHSAEALLLARYFMYIQVYFHPIRRMYDKHLIDFLRSWLPGGTFPTTPEELLCFTDIEVQHGMFEASRDPSKPGHDSARRILNREHFRLLYTLNPEDSKLNPEAGQLLFDGLRGHFGEEKVHRDNYIEQSGFFDFPVLAGDENIISSSALSDTLSNIPIVNVDNIFAAPEIIEESRAWLDSNRQALLESASTEEETT